MIEGVVPAIGGLGLFLLGMAVMTDGLRAMADDHLRALLARSTRSPISGAVTGAISTALVQSSSATTVAAIGFVGAGLMTFPQALGILFGANIGTTITGWLVALLGFKLKLGEILLPLVLVGVMFRFFGSPRWKGFGNAIAGFGLIFVGIATLQDGMSAFSNVVTPDSFPPDTLVGRMLLVLIGLGMTVVTQSSSAGVALALTAVSIGNITLAQAAAMVIGMDIGTTVTALVATVGGSVQARRTGLAHVIYNLMTGAAALLLLTPYLLTLDIVAPGFASNDPELALVGFHTFFNFVGVIAVLPLTSQFASLIARLVPEKGNPLTRRLDSRLIGSPDLAVAAVQASVRDLVTAVFGRLDHILQGQDESEMVDPKQIDEAIQMTQQYLSSALVASEKESLFRIQQASIHILDHLRRLSMRMRDRSRLETVVRMDSVGPEVECLAGTAQQVANHPESINEGDYSKYRADYQRLKQIEKRARRQSIAAAARGEFELKKAVAQADAVRRLRRIGYHVWRVTRQLKDEYSDLK